MPPLPTYPQVLAACREPGVVITDMRTSRAHGQQHIHLPQISRELGDQRNAAANNAVENLNRADRRDPAAFGGVVEDGQRYHLN